MGLLNGVGNLSAPEGARVFAAILGIAALAGEVPFVLWLLVKGVDEARWRSACHAAGGAASSE